jgi:hypothetical protein
MGLSGNAEKAHPVRRVTNDAELRQVNPDARTFMLPHQQHLSSPQQQEPFAQGGLPGYQKSFTSNPQSIRQDYTTMATAMPSGFLPLGSVAEEYQIQRTTAGMRHVPLEARLGVGQGTDGFGDVGGFLATEMEVDGVNFWWDQSYPAAFEADLDLMNQPFHGGGGFIYPYGRILEDR